MASDEDEDLEFEVGEATMAFKAEMAATKFFSNYWKGIVGVVVVVLVGILVYGQYLDYVQRTQRNFSADAARSVKPVTEEVPLVAFLTAIPNEQRPSEEELIKSAKEIESVLVDAWGPEKASSLLTAAELHRMTNDVEGQKRALQTAAAEGTDIIQFAAESGLASMELSSGEGEQALSRLKALSANPEPFLAQRATLDWGLALEQLDKKEEAKGVYNEFLSKWPASKLLAEVNARLALLGVQ